jgi:peptidoglycan/xylan/chitin deacetylase (PgdA/CDA1 family)
MGRKELKNVSPGELLSFLRDRAILRFLKLTSLRLAGRLGLNSLVLNGRWRQQRLLILCYHGLALEDEDKWRPNVFIPAALFRARMDLLRRLDTAVLPLGEAIQRLYGDTLPKRAVAITFDDGGHDFYRLAYPILQEHSFPATVYLSTYYSVLNRPVFDVMLTYLLWKGTGKTLNWPEFLAGPVLLDERGRSAAELEIKAKMRRNNYRGTEKDRILESLSVALDIDYEQLCAKRILQLMTLDEVKEIVAGGIDVQLHTHRHRVPRARDLFLKEIEDNRKWIETVCARTPVHFCYPCGFHTPQFLEFLEAAAVESATTCELGLAAKTDNRFLLPRLLDTSTLTTTEFEAWVSGTASFLPQRKYPPLPESILQDIAPNS